MSRSEEVELKSCPFCGGEAEMDTRQGYNNYSTGARETGIAIYCRDCSVQHMICRGDVPDVEPEEVIELWNTRAPSALPVGWKPDLDQLATCIAQGQYEYDLGAAAPDCPRAEFIARRVSAMLSASPPEPGGDSSSQSQPVLANGQTEEGAGKYGIKACVEWLHDFAQTMNDPKAKSIVNGAAWNLGHEMRASPLPTSGSDEP